jgi:predicted nucleic acid-binding protein
LFNAEDKQKLKQVALDYIQRLTRDCPLVVPTIETVHLARDIFFDNAQIHYMSFIDCLLLETAKQLDLIIFTKDRRMSEEANKLSIPLHETSAL